MNQTTNKATGETINYNRIGGTPDNPIYFNDPTPSSKTPVNKTVTVIKYVDNPDGTTTNYLSDGTTSLVKYSQLPDGSLQPYEVQPTGKPVNITGDSLASANKIAVPNINYNSPSSAIIASTTTGAQTDIQKAQADYEAAQKASDMGANAAQSLIAQKALELYNQRGDITKNQTQLEDNAGIAEQRKALNDINTQIADQQIQLRAEQDRIRNTPQSKAQAQQELNVLEDTYGRRLADLAIRKSAAQGNIEAIQNDAERKTKLLLAPIDNALEYYKTFGQQNADYLTKKEQEKLSAIQTNLQNQKKDIETLQKAKAEMITELANNGGGKSDFVRQINDAKSLADVYALGAKSGYVGSVDRAYKIAQTNKLNADAQQQTLPQVTLDASKYAPAIQVVLGSGKLTKDQKADFIRSVNSGQDPVVVLKNKARELLGQTEGNKILDLETAKSAINDLSSQLNEFYAQGGKTGLLSGTYEQVINKLGKVNDPKLVSIATNIATSIQTYRNAVSGTAYSVQEGQQIDSVFPGITKSQGLNNAIINGRIRSMDTTLDSRYRSVLGNTYDAIKNAKPIQDITPTASDPLGIIKKVSDITTNPLGI